MAGLDELFLDGHCVHGQPIRMSVKDVRVGTFRDDCPAAKKEQALAEAVGAAHRSLSLKERLTLWRGRRSLRRRFDDLLN